MRDTEDIIFDADSALLSQQRTLPDMVASELGLLREPFKSRFFSANEGGASSKSATCFLVSPNSATFFYQPPNTISRPFQEAMFGPLWSFLILLQKHYFSSFGALVLRSKLWTFLYRGATPDLFFATQFSAKGQVGYPPCRKILQSITLKVPYCVARLFRCKLFQRALRG